MARPKKVHTRERVAKTAKAANHQAKGNTRKTGVAFLETLDLQLVIDHLDSVINLYSLDENTPYGFKYHYMRKSFLKKYPGATRALSPAERRHNAIIKMEECESYCAVINKEGIPHCFGDVVHLARKYILAFLGTSPSPDIFEHAAFTSGATSSRTRDHGDAYFKYDYGVDGLLHTTSACRPYAETLIKGTPLWESAGGLLSLTVVPYGVVTTVPKDNVIDRPIIKEPDMNMLLQRCVGREIGARLKRGIVLPSGKRVSFDLTDQTVNQEHAWYGSVFNDRATIDLSSASDMISHRVVWELLPPRWYTLLDDLRTKYGYDKETSKLYCWEKFSAMGNGFTFELESLIFAALALACCDISGGDFGKVGVYGDDIICCSLTQQKLITVLTGFGFKPNPDKSFTDGPFRESCGKHYYNGHDVTPIYARDYVGDAERYAWLLNSLRKWSYDQELGVCDPAIYPLWLKLFRSSSFLKHLRGGYDCSSITQIASPGKPKYRLMRKTKTIKRPDELRCLLRYFQNNDSNNIFDPSDGASNVDYLLDLKGFRLVRAPSKIPPRFGLRLKELWPNELL